jgi:hypothetical protein
MSNLQNYRTVNLHGGSGIIEMTDRFAGSNIKAIHQVSALRIGSVFSTVELQTYKQECKRN